MSLIITRNTKGSLLTPAQGDDQIAFSTRYLSGALTLSSTHNREVLECNGTFAITLPDAATLQTSLHESANYGDIGFSATVVNVGTGVITIDLTTAADTLAGVANGTHTLAPERSMTLVLNSNGGTADGYIVPAPSSGGVFSNNSNGNPTIEDTVFDVVNEVNAFDAYESVGPTGAGATHTWAALDSVPAGVDWVEVSVNLHLFLTAASVDMRILARATGSSSTAQGPQTIAFFGFGDDTVNTKVFDAFSIAKVPVNSSGLFDIFYTGDGNTPSSHAYMYVTGYGWN